MISSHVSHPGPTTPWVLHWIGRLWMWVFGWRFEGEIPQVERAVLIAAPHTSNWDLPHMLAAAWVLRLRVSWLGKHTLFSGPFGWLFRALGGVPVDRRAPRGLVQQVADTLGAADKLVVAVPPSGTRSRAAHWKSGFYWIAHTAQVPIVCGYLDFRTRRASLGLSFVPTGDVRADMDRIRAFYDGVRGRFPEQETPILLKEELEVAQPAPKGAAVPAPRTVREG